MRIKAGVTLRGVQGVMLPVIAEAEILWISFGRTEGVTITSATEGRHMPLSKHYQGLALDFRTRYFEEETKKLIGQLFYQRLISHAPEGVCYQVLVEPDHIHVELDEVFHLKFSDPVPPLEPLASDLDKKPKAVPK